MTKPRISADNDNLPFNRVDHLKYGQRLYSSEETARHLAGRSTKPTKVVFDTALERYVPGNPNECRPLKIAVPFDPGRASRTFFQKVLAKGAAKAGCATTYYGNFKSSAERAEARGVVKEKAEIEQIAMNDERARIIMRQSIGRLRYREANDNIDLPIVKLLKTENETEYLKIVLMYRKLVRECSFELSGASIPEGTSQLVMNGKLDETTGRIQYKGVKLVTGKRHVSDIPQTMSAPTKTDDGTPERRTAKPVPKPWSGEDQIIAAIDGRRTLDRLRAHLGPLTDPFEDAVLNSATLGDIGHRYGCGNDKAAKGGGRSLLWLAFVTVQRAWAEIDPRMRAAA